MQAWSSTCRPLRDPVASLTRTPSPPDTWKSPNSLHHFFQVYRNGRIMKVSCLDPLVSFLPYENICIFTYTLQCLFKIFGYCILAKFIPDEVYFSIQSGKCKQIWHEKVINCLFYFFKKSQFYVQYCKNLQSFHQQIKFTD